ncbi:EF-hand domain-containing family member C2-like [Uloborus diversus]|uniref:EF-hand domain-containing family member C2-like n=1 Tax=Uloborus diversus TaxID=327109 RepID=UPI00240999B4|nr:EF-hand domain-containing family member C2-like [Uloborus diversus]
MKFRKCYILYYVEDGTIKVYEPQQKNTGFLQGTLINRNIISKPEGGYYTLDDLNIGETLNMFGKTFKILDCDDFTRQFMREMGYRLGTPEKEIDDPVYVFETHFVIDSNPVKSGVDSEEYYTAKDLDLGKTIEVFGANVFLYDSDDFTKEYYKKEYNKELIPVSIG